MQLIIITVNSDDHPRIGFIILFYKNIRINLKGNFTSVYPQR